MFTMRATKTYSSAQSLGFFDVELRSIGRWRNAAAIGLINLIYNLARYEPIVRLKLLLSEPEATNHSPGRRPSGA
jgi:hypothetical protein